jgi:hypothetical protein
MFVRGPDKVEVLLILIPFFLLFPVVFVVLLATSLQAKKREAEVAKALFPKAREE